MGRFVKALEELADQIVREDAHNAALEKRDVSVIHILYQGKALCGKAGPPIEWESNHMWVGRTNIHQATCEPCIETAKAKGERWMS